MASGFAQSVAGTISTRACRTARIAQILGEGEAREGELAERGEASFIRETRGVR